MNQHFGVVNRSVYHSSRGEVIDLCDMEVSHLMNVIALHERQYDALVTNIDHWQAQGLDASGLEIWRDQLDNTIMALCIELNNRGLEQGGVEI